MSEKEKNRQEIVTSNEVLRSEIKKDEEAILQLSYAESKCPVCETKLTEEKKKKIVEKKQKEIEENKREIEKLIKEKVEAERLIDEIKKKLKEIEEMKILAKDKERLLKELEFDKSALKIDEDNKTSVSKEIESMRSGIKEKEELLRRTLEEKSNLEAIKQRILDLESLIERRREYEKRKEEIEKKIVELEKLLEGKNIEEMERRLIGLISKEKEVAIEIKGMEEIVRRETKRKEEIEKSLEFAEREKTQVERLNKILIDLKVFKQALEITQVKIREDFIETVNHYMANIWPSLYPYGGRWVNVEGIASGGERSLACLALRIAFSLALAPQLRILILDEPTHNLDQKAVEELAKVLRENISEFMDQVFIITHDERLQEAVTGKAYKLERDKSVDGYTQVVEVV
jgi:DNA repair exonuclease SbcCD ATPase subunit